MGGENFPSRNQILVTASQRPQVKSMLVTIGLMVLTRTTVPRTQTNLP